MKTPICLSCYQPCSLVEVGEHTQIKMEVSDCCGEAWKHTDSDLVEWHMDLTAQAECLGLGHLISRDPEKHFIGFDQGFDSSAELKRIVDNG